LVTINDFFNRCAILKGFDDCIESDMGFANAHYAIGVGFEWNWFGSNC